MAEMRIPDADRVGIASSSLAVQTPKLGGLTTTAPKPARPEAVAPGSSVAKPKRWTPMQGTPEYIADLAGRTKFLPEEDSRYWANQFSAAAGFKDDTPANVERKIGVYTKLAQNIAKDAQQGYMPSELARNLISSASLAVAEIRRAQAGRREAESTGLLGQFKAGALSAIGNIDTENTAPTITSGIVAEARRGARLPAREVLETPAGRAGAFVGGVGVPIAEIGAATIPALAALGATGLQPELLPFTAPVIAAAGQAIGGQVSRGAAQRARLGRAEATVNALRQKLANDPSNQDLQNQLYEAIAIAEEAAKGVTPISDAARQFLANTVAAGVGSGVIRGLGAAVRAAAPAVLGAERATRVASQIRPGVRGAATPLAESTVGSTLGTITQTGIAEGRFPTPEELGTGVAIGGAFGAASARSAAKVSGLTAKLESAIRSKDMTAVQAVLAEIDKAKIGSSQRTRMLEVATKRAQSSAPPASAAPTPAAAPKPTAAPESVKTWTGADILDPQREPMAQGDKVSLPDPADPTKQITGEVIFVPPGEASVNVKLDSGETMTIPAKQTSTVTAPENIMAEARPFGPRVAAPQTAQAAPPAPQPSLDVPAVRDAVAQGRGVFEGVDAKGRRNIIRLSAYDPTTDTFTGHYAQDPSKTLSVTGRDLANYQQISAYEPYAAELSALSSAASPAEIDTALAALEQKTSSEIAAASSRSPYIEKQARAIADSAIEEATKANPEIRVGQVRRSLLKADEDFVREFDPQSLPTTLPADVVAAVQAKYRQGIDAIAKRWLDIENDPRVSFMPDAAQKSALMAQLRAGLLDSVGKKSPARASVEARIAELSPVPEAQPKAPRRAPVTAAPQAPAPETPVAPKVVELSQEARDYIAAEKSGNLQEAARILSNSEDPEMLTQEVRRARPQPFMPTEAPAAPKLAQPAAPVPAKETAPKAKSERELVAEITPEERKLFLRAMGVTGNFTKEETRAMNLAVSQDENLSARLEAFYNLSDKDDSLLIEPKNVQEAPIPGYTKPAAPVAAPQPPETPPAAPAPKPAEAPAVKAETPAPKVEPAPPTPVVETPVVEASVETPPTAPAEELPAGVFEVAGGKRYRVDERRSDKWVITEITPTGKEKKTSTTIDANGVVAQQIKMAEAKAGAVDSRVYDLPTRAGNKRYQVLREEGDKWLVQEYDAEGNPVKGPTLLDANGAYAAIIRQERKAAETAAAAPAREPRPAAPREARPYAEKSVPDLIDAMLKTEERALNTSKVSDANQRRMLDKMYQADRAQLETEIQKRGPEAVAALKAARDEVIAKMQQQEKAAKKAPTAAAPATVVPAAAVPTKVSATAATEAGKAALKERLKARLQNAIRNNNAEEAAAVQLAAEANNLNYDNLYASTVRDLQAGAARGDKGPKTPKQPSGPKLTGAEKGAAKLVEKDPSLARVQDLGSKFDFKAEAATASRKNMSEEALAELHNLLTNPSSGVQSVLGRRPEEWVKQAIQKIEQEAKSRGAAREARFRDAIAEFEKAREVVAEAPAEVVTAPEPVTPAKETPAPEVEVPAAETKAVAPVSGPRLEKLGAALHKEMLPEGKNSAYKNPLFKAMSEGVLDLYDRLRLTVKAGLPDFNTRALDAADKLAGEFEQVRDIGEIAGQERGTDFPVAEMLRKRVALLERTFQNVEKELAEMPDHAKQALAALEKSDRPEETKQFWREKIQDSVKAREEYLANMRQNLDKVRAGLAKLEAELASKPTTAPAPKPKPAPKTVQQAVEQAPVVTAEGQIVEQPSQQDLYATVTLPSSAGPKTVKIDTGTLIGDEGPYVFLPKPNGDYFRPKPIANIDDPVLRAALLDAVERMKTVKNKKDRRVSVSDDEIQKDIDRVSGVDDEGINQRRLFGLAFGGTTLASAMPADASPLMGVLPDAVLNLPDIGHVVSNPGAAVAGIVGTAVTAGVLSSLRKMKKAGGFAPWFRDFVANSPEISGYWNTLSSRTKRDVLSNTKSMWDRAFSALATPSRAIGGALTAAQNFGWRELGETMADALKLTGPAHADFMAYFNRGLLNTFQRVRDLQLRPRAGAAVQKIMDTVANNDVARRAVPELQALTDAGNLQLPLKLNEMVSKLRQGDKAARQMYNNFAAYLDARYPTTRDQDALWEFFSRKEQDLTPVDRKRFAEFLADDNLRVIRKAIDELTDLTVQNSGLSAGAANEYRGRYLRTFGLRGRDKNDLAGRIADILSFSDRRGSAFAGGQKGEYRGATRSDFVNDSARDAFVKERNQGWVVTGRFTRKVGNEDVSFARLENVLGDIREIEESDLPNWNTEGYTKWRSFTDDDGTPKAIRDLTMPELRNEGYKIDLTSAARNTLMSLSKQKTRNMLAASIATDPDLALSGRTTNDMNQSWGLRRWGQNPALGVFELTGNRVGDQFEAVSVETGAKSLVNAKKDTYGNVVGFQGEFSRSKDNNFAANTNFAPAVMFDGKRWDVVRVNEKGGKVTYDLRRDGNTVRGVDSDRVRKFRILTVPDRVRASSRGIGAFQPGEFNYGELNDTFVSPDVYATVQGLVKGSLLKRGVDMFDSTVFGGRLWKMGVVGQNLRSAVTQMANNIVATSELGIGLSEMPYAAKKVLTDRAEMQRLEAEGLFADLGSTQQTGVTRITNQADFRKWSANDSFKRMARQFLAIPEDERTIRDYVNLVWHGLAQPRGKAAMSVIPGIIQFQDQVARYAIFDRFMQNNLASGMGQNAARAKAIEDTLEMVFRTDTHPLVTVAAKTVLPWANVMKYTALTAPVVAATNPYQYVATKIQMGLLGALTGAFNEDEPIETTDLAGRARSFTAAQIRRMVADRIRPELSRARFTWTGVPKDVRLNIPGVGTVVLNTEKFDPASGEFWTDFGGRPAALINSIGTLPSVLRGDKGSLRNLLTTFAGYRGYLPPVTEETPLREEVRDGMRALVGAYGPMALSAERIIRPTRAQGDRATAALMFLVSAAKYNPTETLRQIDGFTFGETEALRQGKNAAIAKTGDEDEQMAIRQDYDQRIEAVNRTSEEYKRLINALVQEDEKRGLVGAGVK